MTSCAKEGGRDSQKSDIFQIFDDTGGRGLPTFVIVVTVVTRDRQGRIYLRAQGRRIYKYDKYDQ